MSCFHCILLHSSCVQKKSMYGLKAKQNIKGLTQCLKKKKKNKQTRIRKRLMELKIQYPMCLKNVEYRATESINLK